MSAIILPGNVASMPALSLRQPWPWLVTRPDLTDPAERAAALAKGWIKTIENRDWPTRFRGDFLIHAGKLMPMADYDAALLFIELYVDPVLVHQVPDPAELQRGGVVGMATLTDCVTSHTSGWFTGGFSEPGVDGGYGYVLQDAKPLPFIPWKGMQKFFNVRVRP